MINMISTYMKHIKNFDLTTYSHSMNVASLSSDFTLFVKENSDDFNNINPETMYKCGILHDIGKIKIDKLILNKKEKLTNVEFLEIKRHPLLGYNLLYQNSNIELEVLYCTLYHHKGLNNVGYPSLKENLPIKYLNYIDILSISDIFDALTSKRSYKNPYSKETSLNIMGSCDINLRLFDLFKKFIR